MINPEYCSKALGIVIRKERLKKQWTQFDLAFEVNVHQSYISDIENGKINYSLLIFLKIANALEVRPSVLLINVEERLERR